jgi:hypothetical protein
MKWDGTDLTIIGGIRQTSPGVREPQLKGVWTVSNQYFNNDIVSYNGQSWICTSVTSHTSTNNTNASTGYPGYGPWNTYISSGSDGESGPGVVYRGPFASGTQYFNTTTRRDVVQGTDGQYYLCKLTYTPSDNTTRPIGGASYTTYWETFGATFSSVATDILFAQDVYSNRTINVGVSGSGPAIVLNSDAPNTGSNPFISIAQGTNQGYDNLGIFLGYDTGSAKLSLKSNTGNYLRWTGTELQVQGRINATDGFLGSGNDVWRIENQLLYSSASVGQIKLNASRPAIEIYDSGSNLTVDINSNLNLSPLTPTTLIATGSLSGMPTPQEEFPNGAAVAQDVGIFTNTFLSLNDIQYITSSNSASIYVPSNAAGLTVEFTIATEGTQRGNVSTDIYGGVSSADMWVEYGVLVYWIPQNVSQINSNEEFVGIATAYATDTFTDFSYSSNNENLQASMVRTFNISTTLNGGGGYYRFKPYVGTYSINGSGTSYPDNIPRLDHELTLTNEVLGQYYPKTPRLSSLNASVANSKTEIIAGGFQVAFSQNRYVQIPRSSVGSMLKVAGGLEVISTATDGITSPSGSVNVHGGLYAQSFENLGSNIPNTTSIYSKLVNGMIVQAGYAFGTSVPTTVTFPLAFPTRCAAVTCATDRNSSGANGYNHVFNVTTSGCSLVLDQNFDGWWIAIGY